MYDVRFAIVEFIPAEDVMASQTAEIGQRVASALLPVPTEKKEYMMQHYLVLYNPHAANAHGEENANQLKTILDGSTLVFQDVTQISDYARFFDTIPKETALIISGGDGTLIRFINGTTGIALPENIFYFAGGSRNDFLRMWPNQIHRHSCP